MLTVVLHGISRMSFAAELEANCRYVSDSEEQNS